MEIIVWGTVIHISSSAGVSVGIGKLSSGSHCNQCKMRAFASGRGAQCPSAAGAGGTQGLRGTPRVSGGPPCCDGGVAAVPAGLHCQQCPWGSALPVQWASMELSSTCHNHMHKDVSWTREALKDIFMA